MNPAAVSILEPDPLPEVREITLDHPWRWLEAGWHDLTRAPGFSLSYGAVFTLVSALLTLGLVREDLFFIIPPLGAGFFLVAPLLGIGLYKISESLEQKEPVEFCQAWRAWKRNEVHLAGMGVTLVLVLLAWMLAAILIFALLFQQPVPTMENIVPVLFLSGDSPAFLVTGVAIGGLIAAFTFSITVISVPLLMDRQLDLMSAMQTSLKAVRMNWQPMALWACLIVMFVGIGLVTFYVGLIVAMPLVGHATWHAYRDLVEPDPGIVPLHHG
jgi:uncharacterized membrane protein